MNTTQTGELDDWHLKLLTGVYADTLAFTPQTLTADNFVLIQPYKVKDINPGVDSSYPNNLRASQNFLYFTADNGVDGIELWKTNGTEAGTILVADINPDGSSSPAELTNINDTLYFRATNTSNGEELWQSQGSPETTVIVKDILQGFGDSYLLNLTKVGDRLYFTANDGHNGEELWQSHGTAATTLLVKNINPFGSSYPSNLSNVNGILYFKADDGSNGEELWRSDGTQTGTVLVKDINPSGNSSITNLTNVNDILYFTADNGTHGVELWKTDGTPQGTVLVKDIHPSASSHPNHLTNVNGILYFTANDGTHDVELWKTDGTPQGTVLVKDIHPSASSHPNHLTNVNGILYFTANDGTHGVELWKTDGTPQGTILVKDIDPGAEDSSPSYLTPFNGILYFTADDGNYGTELWTSDGTSAGTVLVKDINPGYADSYPTQLTVVNQTLYFTADDGSNGEELWALSIPSVSIIPIDINASEVNTKSGTVQIVRTGDTSTPLTVSYSLGGSAENGVDYQNLSGSATIPAGQTSVDITVTPIDDDVTENQESVVITLVDAPEYEIDLFDSATVFITDNDSNQPRDNDSRLVKNDDHILTILGGEGKPTLEVTMIASNSSWVDELGVFVVDDDQGKINGITPGEAGYAEAALQRARVVFSSLTNQPDGFNAQGLTSRLEFAEGDRLRFLLVKNGTIASAKVGETSIGNVVFSGVLTQTVADITKSKFTLTWQDGQNQNPPNFSNLVVTIQGTNQSLNLGTKLQSFPEGELIDLRDITTPVRANFIVNREAAFDNFIGFYPIVDAKGGIDINGDRIADLYPGDSQYITTAVLSRLSDINLSVPNQGQATYTAIFQPGAIYAPFMIVNSNPNTFTNNISPNYPDVYFPFIAANLDQIDHIRLLGNNIFGFEDIKGGGDRDYNDMVVTVNLTLG